MVSFFVQERGLQVNKTRKKLEIMSGKAYYPLDYTDWQPCGLYMRQERVIFQDKQIENGRVRTSISRARFLAPRLNSSHRAWYKKYSSSLTPYWSSNGHLSCTSLAKSCLA
jgi:ribosome biogenesis protein Nip4